MYDTTIAAKLLGQLKLEVPQFSLGLPSPCDPPRGFGAFLRLSVALPSDLRYNAKC